MPGHFLKTLGEPDQNSGGDNLDILSANLFVRPPLPKFTHNVKDDMKSERLSVFANLYLGRYNLVCLQEVFGSGSTRRRHLLEKAAKLGFVNAVVSPQGWKPVDGGLVILSKFPILEADYITFQTQGASADRFSSKGALHAVVDLQPANPQGTKMHVFTTHTQASYAGKVPEDQVKEARKGQLLELVSFIKKCQKKHPEIPTIVTGDMNINAFDTNHPSEGLSAEYESMRHILATGASCTDLVLQLNANKHFVTFAETQTVNGQEVAGEEHLTSPEDWQRSTNRCLDYIFFGEGPNRKLKPTSTGVQKLKVDPATTQGGFTQLSDHFGVEAQMRIL